MFLKREIYDGSNKHFFLSFLGEESNGQLFEHLSSADSELPGNSEVRTNCVYKLLNKNLILRLKKWEVMLWQVKST